MTAIRASILLFCCVALRAATIPGPGYLNQVVICDTNNTHCSTLAQSNNTALSYSNTLFVNGNAFNINANDQVQPGVLHAYAHFSTLVAQTFYTQFQIGAQVYDDFTFGGGTTGAVGYVAPAFTVTGTSTGAANAQLSAFWEDGTDGILHVLPAQYTSGSANLSFARIPFHYGTPIMIAFAFGAIDYPSGSLSATSDFSHTAILSGLPTYKDQTTTTALTGTTITAASGTIYTAEGVLPEPATWMSLGIGLFAVMFGRRRFRHR
jgi:PEP-CTERM motif